MQAGALKKAAAIKIAAQRLSFSYVSHIYTYIVETPKLTLYCSKLSQSSRQFLLTFPTASGQKGQISTCHLLMIEKHEMMIKLSFSSLCFTSL